MAPRHRPPTSGIRLLGTRPYRHIGVRCTGEGGSTRNELLLSPAGTSRPGTHCCVAVGRWPSECAALSKSCVGAHSRADSRADRRSSNLVTLRAGVVTATDVTECGQSAFSAPVMVFTEKLETVGTTAFAWSGWPDLNRRPLDPQISQHPREPLWHKGSRPPFVLHSKGGASYTPFSRWHVTTLRRPESGARPRKHSRKRRAFRPIAEARPLRRPSDRNFNVGAALQLSTQPICDDMAILHASEVDALARS